MTLALVLGIYFFIGMLIALSNAWCKRGSCQHLAEDTAFESMILWAFWGLVILLFPVILIWKVLKMLAHEEGQNGGF